MNGNLSGNLTRVVDAAIGVTSSNGSPEPGERLWTAYTAGGVALGARHGVRQEVLPMGGALAGLGFMQ